MPCSCLRALLNNNVQILVFLTKIFESPIEETTSSGCVVHVLVHGHPGFKTAVYVYVYEYRFAEYECDLVSARRPDCVEGQNVFRKSS